MTSRSLGMGTRPRRRFLLDQVPMMLVMAAALLLVDIIGFGQAVRTITQMRATAIAAQGETLRQMIELFLRADRPLRELAGFVPEAQVLRDLAPEITAVVLVDRHGRVLERLGTEPVGFRPAPLTLPGARQSVSETDDALRVHLGLMGRLRPDGELRITFDRSDIIAQARAKAWPVHWSGLACLIGFGLVLLMANRLPGRWRRQTIRAGFVFLFLVQVTVVLGVNYALFMEGVHDRNEGLARAMADRIEQLDALGLDLEAVDGLDRAFARYRSIHPEVSEIALLAGNTIRIHWDPGRVGESYRPPDSVLEYRMATIPGGENLRLILVVTTPMSVILDQIWQEVRNMLVLLVATVLMGTLFLDVKTALSRGVGVTDGLAIETTLIRPAYFLIMFSEMLSVSFLPQLIEQSARSAGLDADWASVPFTAYFLAAFLTAAVVPPLVERLGFRLVIGLGMVLAAIGVLAIALAPTFWVILIARLLSGSGISASAVAVFAYLMSVVPAEQRTRAASVAVFAGNAAVICGSAIGALLIVQFSISEVFAGATAVAGAALIYLWLAVPPGAATERAARAPAWRAFVGMGRLLRDRDVLLVLLAVTVVSGIVDSGMVRYGMPLILSDGGMPQAEIGQVLMLYAVALVVSARLSAGMIDRLSSPRLALAAGGVITAAGLALVGIGLLSPDAPESLPGTLIVDELRGLKLALADLAIPGLDMILLATGVILVGVGQALITAPTSTFIASRPVMRDIGAVRGINQFNMVEPIGRVLGPVLVAQLLILQPQGPLTAFAVGLFSMVGALAFLALSRRGR